MLSVIIMTRNEEKRIGRMLQSIKDQNFHGEYEIIIVDAHSSDNTRKIISSYFNRLPLRIVDGEGKGIGADRNIGGNCCNGDVLFFTEGDCFLNKGFLFELQRLFRNKNLMSWSTITFPIKSSGLIQFTYKMYDVARYLLTKIPYPFKGYSTSGAILVIRKDVWLKVGGFKEGTNMNDDGFMGRKIRDHYRGKDQFIFCINPKYPIYRIADRFNNGYFKTLNHYIYVLGNFFPFLLHYLKNQMVYEGQRFTHEKN